MTKARRLRDDGVAAQCVQLDGMIHASMHMLGLAPKARGLFDVAGQAMRKALGT